jgi:hypothetical protein
MAYWSKGLAHESTAPPLPRPRTLQDRAMASAEVVNRSLGSQLRRPCFVRSYSFSVKSRMILRRKSKALAKSVSEIGSVRHQIRSKSLKAYRFQRSVRLDWFDRAMEELGKLLVLLPQTDAHTWTEKPARNSGAVEHSHRTIFGLQKCRPDRVIYQSTSQKRAFSRPAASQDGDYIAALRGHGNPFEDLERFFRFLTRSGALMSEMRAEIDRYPIAYALETPRLFFAKMRQQTRGCLQ